MDKKTIGGFIAVLRKANGMTQKDLAEKLNVSDKSVSRWERDDGAPDLSLIPVIDGGKILLITYLACITPAAATVMQFAQIKEKDADYAAAINIFTTVAAILTMPVLVSVFNMV